MPHHIEVDDADTLRLLRGLTTWHHALTDAASAIVGSDHSQMHREAANASHLWATIMEHQLGKCDCPVSPLVDDGPVVAA